MAVIPMRLGLKHGRRAGTEREGLNKVVAPECLCSIYVGREVNEDAAATRETLGVKRAKRERRKHERREASLRLTIFGGCWLSRVRYTG